jgi:hypothetical protein
MYGLIFEDVFAALRRQPRVRRNLRHETPRQPVVRRHLPMGQPGQAKEVDPHVAPARADGFLLDLVNERRPAGGEIGYALELCPCGRLERCLFINMGGRNRIHGSSP